MGNNAVILTIITGYIINKAPGSPFFFYKPNSRIGIQQQPIIALLTAISNFSNYGTGCSFYVKGNPTYLTTAFS